jgi:hypothetical protein
MRIDLEKYLSSSETLSDDENERKTTKRKWAEMIWDERKKGKGRGE